MLYLPARGFTGVDITLIFSEGQPVPNPESVQFTLLSYAGDTEQAYRTVRPQDVTLSPGRILAHGLATGTWKLTIVCDGESAITRRVTVKEGPELTPALVHLGSITPSGREPSPAPRGWK